MSIRDLILNHQNIQPVQACGGTVYVRAMAADDMLSMHQYQAGNPERTGLDTMKQVLIRCVCDELGNRQFQDDEAALLGNLAIDDIQSLYDAADELNGLSSQDVDDAEGNSEGSPDSKLDSESPTPSA